MRKEKFGLRGYRFGFLQVYLNTAFQLDGLFHTKFPLYVSSDSFSLPSIAKKDKTPALTLHLVTRTKIPTQFG